MKRIRVLVVIFLVIIAIGGMTNTTQSVGNHTIEKRCDKPPDRYFANSNQGPTKPPDVSIHVFPEKGRGQINTRSTFTICIVNHGNRTLKNHIRVWHSGDSNDMMYILGPDQCLKNDNSIGVRPIGRVPTEDCHGTSEKGRGKSGREDGKVIYSYENGLQPKDVNQYTLITNISAEGEYVIRAQYGTYNWELQKFSPIASDSSEFTATCSYLCTWRQIPRPIKIGLASVIISTLGVLVASSAVRNKLHQTGVILYDRIQDKD